MAVVERFIEKPNLPTGRVSLAVIDGRIDKASAQMLERMGVRLIRTHPIKEAYAAIAYHPDLMLHHAGGKHLLVAPNLDEAVALALEAEGFELELGKKSVGAAYPENVAYNAARVGDFLLCNPKHTDESILEMAKTKGLALISIKQGYAKCSICVVDEAAIITSDYGIFRTLMQYKALVEAENRKLQHIDCCFIQPGHIVLEQMDYGFIGGASGSLSASEILFYGNVAVHPDSEKIQSFLSRYRKKNVMIGEQNRLADFGTFLPLKEYSVVSE